MCETVICFVHNKLTIFSNHKNDNLIYSLGLISGLCTPISANLSNWLIFLITDGVIKHYGVREILAE